MRFLSFLAGLAAFFTAEASIAQTAPPPPPPVAAENVWNLDLSTGGRVSIQLRPDVAPTHVERIKTLTRRGFYDGLQFHRVVEGFMAQGGDPTATGTGSSDLPDLPAEIKGLLHVRGAVGMARGQDLNSANSQFYIMFGPRLAMDRDYTVFGRVIGGMNFVDAIERGEPPPAPTRIVKASIGSDNVPQLSAEALRAAGQSAQAQTPTTGGILQGGTLLVSPSESQPAAATSGDAPQAASEPEEAPKATPQPEE